jgi:hypothetical protein
MTYPAIPAGRPPAVPRDPQSQVQARLRGLVRQVRAGTQRGPLAPTAPLPAFYAVTTASQSMPFDTWTPVLCSTTTIDDDNMATDGHAVIQRTGVYVLSGGVPWPTLSPVAGQVASMLAVNGINPVTNYVPGTQDNRLLTTTAVTVVRSGPVPIHLNAGDVVYLLGFQSAVPGGLATSAGGATTAHLSIVAQRLD